jgi:Tfp pilus assembly protein PilP
VETKNQVMNLTAVQASTCPPCASVGVTKPDQTSKKRQETSKNEAIKPHERHQSRPSEEESIRLFVIEGKPCNVWKMFQCAGGFAGNYN